MRLITVLLVALLSGCTTTYQPVPENYQGDIATFESTEEQHSTSKSDLFYLAKVDGKQIYSTLSATRNATYGKGFYLKTQLIQTQVPAKQATFSIIGRTEHAAPIQAFTDEVYEVKGNVSFIPMPNKEYVVKGKLGPKYSAVWIEHKDTGEIVDKKIEISGSAELGFFEK